MAHRIALVGLVLASSLSSKASLAAGPPGARVNAESKVVCREIVPVGTMVERRLICMSRAAWNKDRTARRDADDFSGEYLRLKDPSNPAMLQLGHAKWETMKPLNARGKLPYPQLVTLAQELFRRGECTIAGQSARKFDIVVNYGVKLDASGNVSRVLVEDTSCSTLNTLIGLVALARAERGDFRSPGAVATGWHADQINLTLQ